MQGAYNWGSFLLFQDIRPKRPFDPQGGFEAYWASQPHIDFLDPFVSTLTLDDDGRGAASIQVCASHASTGSQAMPRADTLSGACFAQPAGLSCTIGLYAGGQCRFLQAMNTTIFRHLVCHGCNLCACRPGRSDGMASCIHEAMGVL